MEKKNFIFLLLSSTALLQGEEVKQGMNLEDAIKESVSNHPEILAKIYDKKAIDYRMQQERAGYLPKVNVQGGAGFERITEAIKANSLNSASRGRVQLGRKDGSVSITQKVFDGLETPNRVYKAQQEGFQADKSVAESRILAAFNASDSYIAVRRFERLLRLAEENVTTHQKILSRVKAQASAGKVTLADQHSVEARLDDAEAALHDIQGELEAARANFQEMVGFMPKNLKKVALNPKVLPATLEEALKKSRDYNRTLKLARSNIAVAKADLDVTQAPFMPAIDLQVDARRNNKVGGINGIVNTMSAQLVAKFNVYNGGADLAKRGEYREKVSAARYRAKREERRAEKEVRVSYAEIISARNQAKALREAVLDKEVVLNTYLEQFNANKRSYIEILDASHEFFLAKGALITADSSEDLSSIRLLAATGTLFEALKMPY
jgi:adhesin transport system outer membrane protein